MAAAKKSAGTPAAAPAATTEATEETPAKKKIDVSDRDYVIVVNGKSGVYGYAKSKEGVKDALESMTAKQREKAFVFKKVPVAITAKVSISWREEEK